MYKNRFISRHMPIDWPMILLKLNHAGVTYDEMGEISGRSGNTVMKIMDEAYKYPEEWDAAFALLDLYTMLHREGDEEVALPRLVYQKPFKQVIKRVRK